MASSSSSFTNPILSLSFIFFLLSGAPTSVKGTFLCAPILAPLIPCFAPLLDPRQQPDNPSSLCCLGVASLSAQANMTLSRPTVCRCLKKLMQSFPIITSQEANNFITPCGFSNSLFPEVDADCIN